MKLYTSGTPTDNHFQVIENQMCSHRLFSMHGNYQREVMKWLDRIRSGVRTFDDYCNGRRDFVRRLDHHDTIMRRTLLEQGVKVEWVPSADAFRQVSARHAAVYPRHIMLDSGAFTAWNKGHVIALDEVKAAYSSFLSKAGGLFDEVWLINLDRIPGSKGRAATDDEKALATKESDRNFIALKAEFGDRVLPVFHQGEGKARLLEVIDQAAGYVCLSPMNDLPERERWLWARRAAQALYDLRCNVRTHGLATTGNEMIRESFLFSGDSAAWKRHGGFGVVDLMEDEPTIDRFAIIDDDDGWEEHEIKEPTRARYRAYHIGRERNDFDRKLQVDLIDNSRHFTRLPEEQQEWVRERVEAYFPFLHAQFSMHVRNLINMSELQKFAATQSRSLWPRAYAKREGKWVDLGVAAEVSPYPSPEDRLHFLADSRLYPL